MVFLELSAQNKMPGLAGWRGMWVGKAKRSQVERCCHKKPKLVMAVKMYLWVDEMWFFRSGALCGLEQELRPLTAGYRQSVVIRNLPLTPLTATLPA